MAKRVKLVAASSCHRILLGTTGLIQLTTREIGADPAHLMRAARPQNVSTSSRMTMHRSITNRLVSTSRSGKPASRSIELAAVGLSASRTRPSSGIRMDAGVDGRRCRRRTQRCFATGRPKLIREAGAAHLCCSTICAMAGVEVRCFGHFP
jgi:hypothetical protein